MLGLERLGLMGGRRLLERLVPPEVAVVPRRVLPGALDDENVLDRGVPVIEGRVDGRLEGRGCAASVATVGGDDDLGLGVVDPRVQRLGGESAEDDGVRGAETGAGEHRDSGLGDHRQVDGDGVALADAEVGQGVCGALDLGVQVGVRDVPGVALGLADEVDGHLVAASGLDVAVDGVDARVELTVGEPLREGGLLQSSDCVKGVLHVRYVRACSAQKPSWSASACS